MKRSLLLGLALISLLFCRCTREKDASSQVFTKVDYAKASIELMEELAPQVEGTWTLREVNVKFQPSDPFQSQIHLSKDSTFHDLAVLKLHPATVSRWSPRDARYAEFEGTIEFGPKTYPVYFYLMANSEWIYQKKGPQAFLLFEYNFPSGTSHLVEQEEAFLKNLGLVDENYSLEKIPGQPAMTWKGLNRSVDKIELRKK